MSHRNEGAPFPLFDQEHSAEVVNARIGPQVDPRTREIASAVVRHLHAAVKEIKPTHEEWLAAIQFLTDTGHMCTDWRQEFILLSDTLGVSMLVDAINHPRPGKATENTILGPFYVPNSPVYANGTNICLDAKGEPLVVNARLTDKHGNAVAGASVEIWQTNDDGFYDVQQKGLQPENNLRGHFTSDAEGRVWFRTVKPRYYPIPDDGPVGKMLARLGRHPNRAAHIHFIINAPGFETIITHIFAPDCPYLAEDAVFGVKNSLVAQFDLVDDPVKAASLQFTSPYWSVDWDVVMTEVSPG
jgi:protocatechuate 3,4-dioxygenase beta subunit